MRSEEFRCKRLRFAPAFGRLLRRLRRELEMLFFSEAWRRGMQKAA